jgi:hypothetical protein
MPSKAFFVILLSVPCSSRSEPGGQILQGVALALGEVGAIALGEHGQLEHLLTDLVKGDQAVAA